MPAPYLLGTPIPHFSYSFTHPTLIYRENTPKPTATDITQPPPHPKPNPHFTMSDNCGALPGFPSPSPITHTTTTSDANNALGAQLFDNSGLFATSLISSPITYNATNTHSDDNALGLRVSTVTSSL
ncbi:hypothetical protein C370_07361, partial [Cryptococcus neoformans A1-35-8]